MKRQIAAIPFYIRVVEGESIFSKIPCARRRRARTSARQPNTPLYQPVPATGQLFPLAATANTRKSGTTFRKAVPLFGKSYHFCKSPTTFPPLQLSRHWLQLSRHWLQLSRMREQLSYTQEQLSRQISSIHSHLSVRQCPSSQHHYHHRHRHYP